MKTEDELKEKIDSLKAMGSPSALSKARELEWVLGLAEEPDDESDMIVDALMRNINTTTDELLSQIPEFARGHQMFTFWKQGEALKTKKPDNWSDVLQGPWDGQVAADIERERKTKGVGFSWRELIGAEGWKDFVKKHSKKKGSDGYEDGFYTKIPDEAASVETAELIASATKKGTHRPLLDIDLPCVYIPSSTPGHGHLYIDKEMPWKDYKKVLNTLADVGIIEHGYRGASLARGYSALRLPWVKKESFDTDEITPFKNS